jgi:catalase
MQTNKTDYLLPNVNNIDSSTLLDSVRGTPKRYQTVPGFGSNKDLVPHSFFLDSANG